MTAEEAVEILGKRYLASTEAEREADWMAFEALRKQVPKAPANIETGDEIGQCPSCGRNTFWHTSAYFCEGCGQLIDWRKCNERID